MPFHPCSLPVVALYNSMLPWALPHYDCMVTSFAHAASAQGPAPMTLLPQAQDELKLLPTLLEARVWEAYEGPPAEDIYIDLKRCAQSMPCNLGLPQRLSCSVASSRCFPTHIWAPRIHLGTPLHSPPLHFSGTCFRSWTHFEHFRSLHSFGHSRPLPAQHHLVVPLHTFELIELPPFTLIPWTPASTPFPALILNQSVP
jgi:hypothetical protein